MHHMEDVCCGPLLDQEANVAVDEDDAQDEPEESGQVRPTTLSNPYTPSRQEIMEHELTHLPYRNWCAACVRGKGVSHGHRKSEADDDRKVPLIGLDYAFIKKSGEGEDAKAVMSEVTTLVIKGSRSKAVFPIPIPQKGMDPEEYSTRQVLRVLEYTGYAEVILKCDQKSALNKLIASAQQHRSRHSDDEGKQCSGRQQRQWHGGESKQMWKHRYIQWQRHLRRRLYRN